MKLLPGLGRPRLTGLALAALLAPIALTACGDEEPTPPPPSADQRPATLEALPSATPLPTDTAEPTATLDAAAEATKNAAGLPTGDDVILQFARIEPRSNEAALAAELRPNFSMRAGGHVVYAFSDEYSRDDWYQTVITPTLGEALVRKLWDEVGIAELAEKLAPPKLAYSVAADGSVTGPGPLGVIYVKSSKGEARLVISQSDLENPGEGPYAERLRNLHNIIRALEYWRRDTASPASPEIKQLVLFTLGWWQDRRDAWGPDKVTAFGTTADEGASAAALAWPLDEPSLAKVVKATAGAKPTRFDLSGQAAADAWRLSLDRGGDDDSAPLWREGEKTYLVALRPEVPGSNEVVVDYSFAQPPTAVPTKAQAATPAAKPTATKAGSGTSSSAVKPSATPKR